MFNTNFKRYIFIAIIKTVEEIL